MTKPKIERKVIRAFGRMYAPINFFLLVLGLGMTLGFLITFAATSFDFQWLDKAIGGLLIAITGYAEIKDDELD